MTLTVLSIGTLPTGYFPELASARMSESAPERSRLTTGGGAKLRRKGDDDDAAHLLRIMLVLQGAHSQGSGILGFLSTTDATPARTAFKELRDAVADFPWASMNYVPGTGPAVCDGCEIAFSAPSLSISKEGSICLMQTLLNVTYVA